MTANSAIKLCADFEVLIVHIGYNYSLIVTKNICSLLDFTLI